jgi:Resolvase, N terminal domain
MPGRTHTEFEQQVELAVAARGPGQHHPFAEHDHTAAQKLLRGPDEYRRRPRPRSTRDLLNTLAAITAKNAGFRSLGDAWADTTTSHGRLMLTVLGGLAEFERAQAKAASGRKRAA